MTKHPPSPRTLRRRKFLAAVAVAGGAAALGEALLTYPPWLDYDREAERVWETPLRSSASVSDQMRELIRYATLAPSGHNAQPWKFAVEGSTIRLLPDYFRRLPIVDPQDRELWISLGCAVENLDIAAQGAGFATEITGPTPDADFITVHLRPETAPRPTPLLPAIPHRQNTRSSYRRQAVPSADMAKIEGVIPGAGVSLQRITTADQKESILDYVAEGNQRQYGEPLFLNELITWLRFNKPEALDHLDGLYSRHAPYAARLSRLFCNRPSA